MKKSFDNYVIQKCCHTKISHSKFISHVVDFTLKSCGLKKELWQRLLRRGRTSLFFCNTMILSTLPNKKVCIRIELESVVSEAEHHPVIYNIQINTQTYRKTIKHLIVYLKTLNLFKEF